MPRGDLGRGGGTLFDNHTDSSMKVSIHESLPNVFSTVGSGTLARLGIQPTPPHPATIFLQHCHEKQSSEPGPVISGLHRPVNTGNNARQRSAGQLGDGLHSLA